MTSLPSRSSSVSCWRHWIRAWGRGELATHDPAAGPASACGRWLSPGWAGHPNRSRRSLSLRWFARGPVRSRIGVVMRWASGCGWLFHIAFSGSGRRRWWFISRSTEALATVPFPWGMVGRCGKPQLRAGHEGPGLVTACDHVQRSLSLAWLIARWSNSTSVPGQSGSREIQHNGCKR
jgi:hypothetical protein